MHAATVATPTEDAYVRIAALLRPGEWCTYGDISTAARGDARAARAVGRAAATRPDFPHAHRVLRSGGTVADGWGVADGLGPAECRRRLEAEGVAFTVDGRAGTEFRVTGDELALRDRSGQAGGALSPGRRPPPAGRR